VTVWFLLATVLLVAALSGCGDGGKPAGTPATTTTPAASILTGAAQTATFAATQRAIRSLYAHHPEIRDFVYQDVYYTPETRDKVLAVCRLGGPAANARERETSRVFGCAPLIFFFYSFGTQRHVAESVGVARALYGYAAAIEGPYDPRPALTGLLKSWGVR
jgi:hypothetical protein